jgi:hypothetical protein
MKLFSATALDVIPIAQSGYDRLSASEGYGQKE